MGRPPGHALVRWLFLRSLGLVYLVAFVSLWVQVRGLVGSRGILPVGEYLEAARAALGPGAPWQLPTWSWIDPGDRGLVLPCAAGTAAALLAIAGIAQAPALALAWACYLSLVVAGQEFLMFQWDMLLLETGFLAPLLAPLTVAPRRPAREGEPPRAVVWALRWLLFRLTFASGVVKLASGDPSWRSLDALAHHYETQPLPAPAGWLAHQLPGAVQRASTAAMFAVELGAPLLLVAPRRFRGVSFLAFAGLQALIALTGNYGFFNLLAAALALLALDDGHLPARLVRALGGTRSGEPGEPSLRDAARRARRWPGYVVGPVVALVALLSLVPVASLAGGRVPVPAPVAWLHRELRPFHLVSGYGLFAVMTTTRREILIEGSEDGVAWRPYRFRWKPGDPHERPRLVAPHMPRLDWQMWFAALGDWRQSPWTIALGRRILDGSPEVLALLAEDPFPDRPPRHLRMVLWEYRMTDLATLRETGAWWRRERLGLYAPVLESP